GITIGQAVLNGNADQIGSASRMQLGFNLATVVRNGLVADAESVGDLGEAAALRQQTQNFKVARGEVFKRVERISDIRKHQFFCNFPFDIGATPGDPSDCLEKLVRRNALADISCRTSLYCARRMERVVMHAEHQNARLGIRYLQAPDNLETADVGQVKIKDNKVRVVSSESIQRLLCVRRLPDLGVLLRGNQSPQSGPDDRVIVDDQDLHRVTDCIEEDARAAPW